MKMLLTILSIVLFAILNSASMAETRTFTNKSGKEIVAKIVSVSKDWKEVTINSNGKDFPLAPTKLSLDDQQYIKDWLKASGRTKPNQDIPSPAVEPTLEDSFSETEPFTLTLKKGDRIESSIPVANRSIKIELTGVSTDSTGTIIQIGDSNLGISLEVKQVEMEIDNALELRNFIYFTHSKKGSTKFMSQELLGETFDAVATLDADGLTFEQKGIDPINRGDVDLLIINPEFGLVVGGSTDGNEEDKFEGTITKATVTIN